MRKVPATMLALVLTWPLLITACGVSSGGESVGVTSGNVRSQVDICCSNNGVIKASSDDRERGIMVSWTPADS